VTPSSLYFGLSRAVSVLYNAVQSLHLYQCCCETTNQETNKLTELLTNFSGFERSQEPPALKQNEAKGWRVRVTIFTVGRHVAVKNIHVFYIHGSVHRNSVLIRSNKKQQYAGIYLLKICSTYFGCPSHPSTGVHKIVTATSSTRHITYPGNNLRHRALIRPRWRKVVALTRDMTVPEVAVTILCTPDDGCDGHPKHVE